MRQQPAVLLAAISHTCWSARRLPVMARGTVGCVLAGGGDHWVTLSCPWAHRAFGLLGSCCQGLPWGPWWAEPESREQTHRRVHIWPGYL